MSIGLLWLRLTDVSKSAMFGRIEYRWSWLWRLLNARSKFFDVYTGNFYMLNMSSHTVTICYNSNGRKSRLKIS